jgi:hypothetical protein
MATLSNEPSLRSEAGETLDPKDWNDIRALAQLEQLTASFRVSTGSGLSRIKGLGWAEG